jgi:hypothetical protein
VVSKQVFNLEYGVVVREEFASGHVLQLQNIHAVDVNDNFFRPPSEFSLVELKEFYMGLPEY